MCVCVVQYYMFRLIIFLLIFLNTLKVCVCVGSIVTEWHLVMAPEARGQAMPWLCTDVGIVIQLNPSFKRVLDHSGWRVKALRCE